MKSNPKDSFVGNLKKSSQFEATNDCNEPNKDEVQSAADSCLYNHQTKTESSNQSKITKSNPTVPSIDNLKKILFAKIGSLVESVNEPRMRSFSADAIKMNSITDRNLAAEVTCVFCETPKEFSVSTFTPPKSKSVYWTISNFKKHLLSQHKKPEAIQVAEKGIKRNYFDKTAKNDAKKAKNLRSNDDSKKKVGKKVKGAGKRSKKNLNSNTPTEVVPNSIIDDGNDVLFQQITQQLEAVSKSIITNKARTTNMKIQTPSTNLLRFIRVVKMCQDGNCLFRGMAHQLFYCATSDISKQSSELRAEAVTHIRKNFDRSCTQR